MIMTPDPSVHEVASGEIAVWQDESGTIFLKVQQKFPHDPVELAEHEAAELVEVLTRLLKNAQ
jgi:hypothetical protein